MQISIGRLKTCFNVIEPGGWQWFCRVKDLEAAVPCCDIRDYSPPLDRFAAANLIQAPSRIKRASRHGTFVDTRHQ
jgi:hypothetical protein